ncbi:MAG TPA: lysophospholipid acyltransferase family protein [Gemmatimonadales bacterium]|nr:lysophospholipid acyltransferase family protein [Gemmatimonadales bacterium]
MRLRLSPGAARTVVGPLLKTLASSWRIRLRDEERWLEICRARQRHVFLLWHEALLPLLWQHRGQGVAIVVSEAREGQYLSDFAASLGYRSLPGSSTRGGARALLGAVRELKAGRAVAFTPDGPRGPRREIKPGVVAAAQRGGAVVVPVHAEADRAWRLHSWDRFMIPKPLTRVWIRYGRPFEVGPGESGLNEGVELAAARLDEISAQSPWRDEAIAIG